MSDICTYIFLPQIMPEHEGAKEAIKRAAMKTYFVSNKVRLGM